MGLGTESALLVQMKKAQGETNDRLDRLTAAQERTNQLLEWLGNIIAAQRLEPAGQYPSGPLDT